MISARPVFFRMGAAVFAALLVFSGCAIRRPPPFLPYDSDSLQKATVLDSSGIATNISKNDRTPLKMIDSNNRGVERVGLDWESIPLYSLNFDEDGKPINLKNILPATDKNNYDNYNDYSYYLDKMFDNMRDYFANDDSSKNAQSDCFENPIGTSKVPPKKILIFVHGGLNSPEEASRRVINPIYTNEKEVTPLFKVIKDCNYYPVLVNWDTSAVSSYINHLVSIRQGEKTDPVYGFASSPVILGTDIARSIFRAPLVWSKMLINNWLPSLDKRPDRLLDRQIADIEAANLMCTSQATGNAEEESCGDCRSHYLQALVENSDIPQCELSKFIRNPRGPALSFDLAQLDIERQRDSQFQYKQYNSSEMDVSFGANKTDSMSMLVKAILYEYTLPFKIVTSPIIDTFGTSAWNNMLRRTYLLFHDDGEYDHEKNDPSSESKAKNHSCGRTRTPEPGGGLGLFLARLNCEIRKADTFFAENIVSEIKKLNNEPEIEKSVRVVKAVAEEIEESRKEKTRLLFNIRDLAEEQIRGKMDMEDLKDKTTKLQDMWKEDATIKEKAKYDKLSKALETLSDQLKTLCKRKSDEPRCTLQAKKIDTYLNQRNRPWEITLVGHSMGAIVLNETIRRNPLLPIKDIVYMAAASTIRDYESSVIPYLRKNDKTEFYNLMLHPYAEREETYFEEYGIHHIFPRGSLLVLIDGFFSNPLSLYDRTLGRFDNYLLYTHHAPNMPPGIEQRIHVRSFSAGKSDTDPQEHGDFTSNYRFWEERCWKNLYSDGCYDPNLMKAKPEPSSSEKHSNEESSEK